MLSKRFLVLRRILQLMWYSLRRPWKWVYFGVNGIYIHLLSFWKTNQAPRFGPPLVDHSISIFRIPHGVRFSYKHRLSWNFIGMEIRFFFSSANLSRWIPTTVAAFSWFFRQNRCAHWYGLYRYISKVSYCLYRINALAYNWIKSWDHSFASFIVHPRITVSLAVQ